jgi:hypothetical protein
MLIRGTFLVKDNGTKYFMTVDDTCKDCLKPLYSAGLLNAKLQEHGNEYYPQAVNKP